MVFGTFERISNSLALVAQLYPMMVVSWKLMKKTLKYIKICINQHDYNSFTYYSRQNKQLPCKIKAPNLILIIIKYITMYSLI